MAKRSTGTAVEAALAEVSELEATVARWEADAAAKHAEREDLEGRLGDEVLADESSAERLAEQVARLRAGEDVAVRTAVAARRKLTQAKAAVLLAEADAERQAADEDERQADELDRETAPLLEALRGLQGVEYVPREDALKAPRSVALRARARERHKRANGLVLAAQNLITEPARVPAAVG